MHISILGIKGYEIFRIIAAKGQLFHL